MKKLYEFENVRPIILRYAEIGLAKAYNLFYSEEPDFTDKDTYAKTQAMVNILKKYNIRLDYSINYINDNGIPYSFAVDQMVTRLAVHLDYKPFPDWRKEIEMLISKIGKTICNYIETQDDKISALNCISSIFYDEKEVQNYSCYSESTVKNSLALVKKIEGSIRKK